MKLQENQTGAGKQAVSSKSKLNGNVLGHLAAVFTIIVWGTTYISTKVLLKNFAPIEILFIRFVMGYIALWIASPRMLKVEERKREGLFALAGLCGITLYYLMENIALLYTQASNVGVIISVAPFFTALITMIVLKQKGAIHFWFVTGFVLAMIGIGFLNFSSVKDLHLSPKGDLLALGAAVVWAIYSNLGKRISEYGYSTIQTTRRTFFYGMLFMLPFLGKMGFHVELTELAKPVNLGNLVFLGLGASAICFVTWNYAVRELGAVRTSIFIYLTPVITVVTSVIILHETITTLSMIGIVLTLAGLFLSSLKKKEKK